MKMPKFKRLGEDSPQIFLLVNELYDKKKLLLSLLKNNKFV